MLIGEAARSAGLTASAIRFYETNGIVPRATRNAEGYRHFSEKDVGVLRFVRRLRALDIPLDDVREVVRLGSDGVAPCRPMRAALVQRISLVNREIQELIRVRDQLERLQTDADRTADEWPDNCICTLADSDSPDRSVSSSVEVTLQYFEGCPNWEVVDRRLAEFGMAVTYQRIETLAEAFQHGFRGSPTVLVNGSDPFRDPGGHIGLACRVYWGLAGPSGAPSVDELKQAIDAARKESSSGRTAGSFR